jgi:Tetratricopeptide repeat/FecR protein
MKSSVILRSAWFGTLVCASVLSFSQKGSAQPAPAQSFAASPAASENPEASASADAPGIDGSLAASNTPGNSQYADGTHAIDQGRWADAQAIFTKVAAEHGGRADGALYWKAYAQNKQGQGKAAMDTCAELGHAYANSSWIHECGALEIEIRAKAGKPVDPSTTHDDDLKLLALNSLMQKDESKALAQIQEILNGDSSEKLKKEALFILGQHYSDATYAQIVRISYVEGDVRIARGAEKEKPAGAAWEKAVVDLPLETGFSLATGEGRAEIEFEDASTLYLGENSVLTFNDLHTTSGAPYTDMALLSGTVSVNLHPSVAREVYLLKTPTENFTWPYPKHMNGRISSYLDGSAIRMTNGGVLQPTGLGQEVFAGDQTLYVREGRRIDSAGLGDPAAFADWDKWVADRVAQRKADMAEMMKVSGLTTPIPGLAEMKGQGHRVRPVWNLLGAECRSARGG